MSDFERCARCDAALTADRSRVLDDQTDNVFCDLRCFNDWAADNADAIIAFYARLNTYVTN